MPDASPYLVSWSVRALASAREMGRNLRTSAARLELTRVLRELQQRLQQNPLDLGEVKRSRGCVVTHTAVVPYLRIDFSVDTQKNFVRVTDCVRCGPGPADDLANGPVTG
jgi:hypothetical protein